MFGGWVCNLCVGHKLLRLLGRTRPAGAALGLAGAVPNGNTQRNQCLVHSKGSPVGVMHLGCPDLYSPAHPVRSVCVRERNSLFLGKPKKASSRVAHRGTVGGLGEREHQEAVK